MPVRRISPNSHYSNNTKTPVLGRFGSDKRVVPLAGLEPAHLSIPHFECGASTNFTTGAREKSP